MYAIHTRVRYTHSCTLYSLVYASYPRYTGNCIVRRVDAAKIRIHDTPRPSSQTGLCKEQKIHNGKLRYNQLFPHLNSATIYCPLRRYCYNDSPYVKIYTLYLQFLHHPKSTLHNIAVTTTLSIQVTLYNITVVITLFKSRKTYVTKQKRAPHDKFLFYKLLEKQKHVQ